MSESFDDSESAKTEAPIQEDNVSVWNEQVGEYPLDRQRRLAKEKTDAEAIEKARAAAEASAEKAKFPEGSLSERLERLKKAA